MARRSSCRGGAHAWSAALLLCTAAALLSAAFAYDCDSGILQMKPLPQEYDSCYAAPLDSNSIKAACTTALRVRVKNGIVKIVPLVQETFNYSDVGPSDSAPSLNCKDVNASGLFYAGSTTSASVMLYDDFGGPLSNLTKTGADTISLIPAHTYSYRSASPNCIYNYTVVQGCVFGVKAPAKPAATCPAGSIKKTGRFAVAYCAPCTPGTYYDKPSSSCKPCAIGTYSRNFGSLKCDKCDDGYYANVTGLSQCEYCSIYDGYYTDGKTCTACPKNSYTTSDTKGQCYRCDAGKRCCTVGWSKTCPKCPAGDSTPKSYSSIFALETATPSSCFSTGHALCAPKINITVDSTCTISLDNRDNSNHPDDNTYCLWSTSVPVNGSKLSITDIAKFDYYTDNSTLLSGNFTAAASPYLTVSIPDTKCTLRYRALTKPLATLLGAAPKPSKYTTSCPAGQYLETDTDTKPGPCLRCPPGTYSPRASSGRKCFRCPAGTYTNRYGSTLCKRCPYGRASTPGSAWCSACDSNTYPLAAGKGCKACPKDSEIYYRGAGGLCLGNAYGSSCCAAGNCAGQAPCKGPRKSTSADTSDTYTAVLQLVSKTLPQPACKNATFLSCLPVNGKVQVFSSSSSPASLSLETYRTNFTCGNYSNSYYGGFSSPSAAYVSAYEEGASDSISIGLFSDSSKGTLTAYLQSDPLNASPVLSKGVSACSATFKIVSGYAFDLTPPADAKCDPADGEYTYGGRKFCQVCPAGQYKNSTGMCGDCPAGTFSGAAGAASCKPCRAGYSCSAGSSYENTCGSGYFSSKPQTEECSKCPKDTYGTASYDIPTTKCAACPKGTIAPEMATACGVAWDKQFPA